MTFKLLEKLSQDFSELLNDKEEYNVIIEVGQERNKKSFTAHSAVLRYRSSYFNKELTNTLPNDDNNNKIITNPNISAHIFEIILKYIYGGIIDTENMDTRTIYDFMVVATELEFEELSEKLENHLIESKASWLKTHFTFVYHSIFKNNKFQNLKKFCNDIIAKNPSIIFESAKFTSLHESALISILKRNDLQIDESEIWDYLIQWGTAQNPTLPKKLEKWSDENFITLKTTLQQCLPFIRYFHISNSDVMFKIKPYKKILDKQLWNDLKQYFILPDHPVESIILPPRLVLKQELPERKLENHLIESKASWLKTHFTFVYHSIFKNNKFQNLKKFCNDIIAKNPSIIFESAKFTSLHESALISILKRNDLQIDESEIWDYLIQWGTAQNPTLPKKLEKWSDENFITLKTTLQQCLPFIRYFHISNSDVMFKIKPYKKILDKQLWNDLKQYFILPDHPVESIILPPRLVLKQELPERVKEAFSVIINEEHASMISSWIDNRQTSYSLTNNPYEFQLLLRGSKDGFSPRTFWDICNGHDNTIVVTKVEGTDEIIGGFNPLAWDNTKVGWMKTNKSFIFSFKDVDIQNPILSRVKHENEALWYPSDKVFYGPRFGLWEFRMKSDESNFTQDKKNWCHNSINNKYEKSIRTTDDQFSIIDYEVFKVKKSNIFTLFNYYFYK
ncbi:hypothetical protein Glove_217g25 [Diversispora epigaea]|uniref:BTB domain-containing protein n=1 Tax=Diversispora epigaea TaxID=1348612 RepID=A0A397IMT9_9GLOM|nr:hypothetical protein Glove_217g25 [Diversispora epigaea]